MKYCDLVNTKQGSASVHRFSNGNTLPLVQLPFGMAAFCPQTSDGNLRWYYHPDNRSFEGIRLTHQPSPWIADYGAVVFTAQKSPVGLSGEERWSGFRPEDAVLKPYCLKYRLLRPRCEIELAPTQRCAAVKLCFDKDDENYFSVHTVKDFYSFEYKAETNSLYITTNSNFGGECKDFKEYVIVRFPENAVIGDKIIIQDSASQRTGTEISGEDIAMHIRLAEKETEICLATSYISFEQAQINLERETAGRSLEEIKAAAAEIWEEYLSRMEIEAKDEKQLKTFYSCMYRAFLYPHKCYEIDGSNNEIHYCPHDGAVHSGVRYTDNGFWDTYRTVYPFFSIVAKDEMRQMLRSYINEYRECGWLPRWMSIGEHGCMPNTLIDAVIYDGAVKGLIDREDLETALEGMIKHSVTDSSDNRFGRNGASAYCRLGYVPYDEQRESVNLTQDAAYGDWCISVIAKMLGKNGIAAEYAERAKNYKILFDKETGFMRARDSKGVFHPDFTPTGWGRDYTEGSAWQNSFAVPHDIEGLAELYGGREQLIKKIDELFAAPPEYEIVGYDCEIHEITEMAAADFGQCAISNQPSFHIPYIYSALGNTEKTAYWVERLCNEAFSYEDDGFPGDEDNGTMAIWYIFSVLGFYPFCPGKTEFVKGKKQVKRAVINGKEFDADKYSGVINYGEF
ncbi:MAG: GH92 family glycosyl hydrolase [Clostridia bacterium]|nr:GH92 family glycosyl hydrolase [Clostridia bacterium]